MIARAAEGSVRDALSLLDQAIAHAAGLVRGEDVRQMLGPRRPHAHHRSVRGGDARRHGVGAGGAARAIRHRRRSRGGAHRSRRIHALRHAGEDRAGGCRRCRRSPKPSARAGAPSRKSSRCACWRAPGRCCSRASPEVKAAGRPVAAAEMVLVRLAYAADLPTPDDVIRSLDGDGGAGARCAGNDGGPRPDGRACRSVALA